MILWTAFFNHNSGGSLGWKGKGTLMPEFEKVAFELEVSSIGSPKWAEYVSPVHGLTLGFTNPYLLDARQARAIIF
jgi:hypothetical protein